MNDIIIGKDGYLFLDSGNHSVSSLFTGKKGVSGHSIKNFILNIKRRRNFCRNNEIYFTNFIFPEKLYMARGFHDLEVESLYKKWYLNDVIANDIESENIYLEDSLLLTNNAFFKTDTHLSIEGNLAVLKNILPSYFQKDFVKFQVVDF